MPHFRAQQLPKKQPEGQALEDIYAAFCYFYPAYTFSRARKVPYIRIFQMLRVAQKKEAQKMIDMIRAIAAGTSGKKKTIEDGMQYFSDIIEGKDE